MEGLVRHKVIFAEEAIFDYEHCLIAKNYPLDNNDIDWKTPSKYDEPILKFNPAEIRAETEEFIQRHTRRDFFNSLRVRHYDEKLEQWIILFIRRGSRIERNQYWVVCGICFAKDYASQNEYGYWFNSALECKEKEDWVVGLRKQLEVEKQDYEFMEKKAA